MSTLLVNELEGSRGATAFDLVSHAINEYADGLKRLRSHVIHADFGSILLSESSSKPPGAAHAHMTYITMAGSSIP